MNDFSTIQSPDAPVQTCPNNCAEAMAMANQEVDLVRRIDDPIQRNVGITEAYRDLGEAMPNNWWVRLAGYVSTQGGCAMRRTQQWDAQSIGRLIVNPEQAMEALKDANISIFSSVYPPNKFMHECGFERLKECVDAGEIEVDETLMAGLEKLNNGDLQGAADLLAQHEQVEVVQPVYDRHAETFDDLGNAEAMMPGDQTSIPIAYECTRDNLVPLGDLDIEDPFDRVSYYHRLMDRMKQIEGLP
ncbi:hypothetical protein [Actibacterium sp. 188UL27-1]|uniref:DUF2515 family protein n=1 Tax=Actibacterium sp. 188UL27-1 TaxID=2786961 RepID=UPI00195CF780|nr:hypothetical protein [Actibacterium sp. 188UL27-1]MBM7066541.1 hypothetical protein [Actibacterium sp. 188UL27-1]